MLENTMTDSTPTIVPLSDTQLIQIARQFQVSLSVVTDDPMHRGSVLVEDIVPSSTLENLLTRDWLECRDGRLMNEVTLVWLDPDEGWVSHHIGSAMAASQRMFALLRANAEDPNAVTLSTMVEKNIYLFFQMRDGRSKLYLTQPMVNAAFGDDISTWPIRRRLSYLHTFQMEPAEASPKAASGTGLLPKTATSDLLFRMYEIACCNDPKQPVLARVAEHLKEFGYDLSGC
jgi:hypothetical protein